MPDDVLPPASDAAQSPGVFETPGDSPAPDPAEHLPEDLPPVEPPSAKFIVQLFVVPAVIVAGIAFLIIGLRMLTSSQQDWRKLVAELGSTNEHRRWRAANGLAQMLRADYELPPEKRTLSQNPQVAEALAGMLDEQLDKTSPTEEELKHQSFLTVTLGFVDVPETVTPTLREALDLDHDREVRKNAIRSLAVVAGRTAEGDGRLPDEAAIVDELIDVSFEDDVLFRQTAAFTLGLIPTDASRDRLEVLLEDADLNTRVNAAVGLARRKSTAGLPVFAAVFEDAVKPAGEKPAAEALTREQRQSARDAERFERWVVVRNSIKAVGDLAGEMDADQRAKFAGLLAPIAEDHPETAIRTAAARVRQELQSVE